MTQPITTDRLNQFLSNMNAMYADHYTQKGLTFQPAPTFVARKGGKNTKIVQVENGRESSVYCFIENDTGNILKAAGWKAPAKGARGSIWNADCDVGTDKPCNVYGGNLYVR